MAKIQTNEDLELAFHCRLVHQAYGNTSDHTIDRPGLNKCQGVNHFFESGLPNNCIYCGANDVCPTGFIERLAWFRATTWTCPECGTVMTLTSNQDRGLTFTNGSTGQTRLVGLNTIVTDQNFCFRNIQSTTTKVFAPQYITGLSTGSGWSNTDVELIYNGSRTIQFTKTSGGTDIAIKAVYDRTEDGNKVYKIQIKYNCWVAGSNGKPQVSNNQYFRYNISVADSSTVLTLTIEKAGHFYIKTDCNDRYRTLWVDGFGGNFINYHQQYNTWSGNNPGAGLNGLGVGSDGILPNVYLPDYATKSSPTGLPIIINQPSVAVEAGCYPRFYDCGGSQYCGTLQYYFFPYNSSWDGSHVGNPITQASSPISPRLSSGGYGPYTAQGCSSMLQNFFDSASSGGGGYHYGDSSLSNPKFGWIMINPAVLEGISTWVGSGQAIMIVVTGADLHEPLCQMQNSMIKLVKNNSYYVLN